MRRYDARDITEQHFRALRVLLVTGQADAHIVVRSRRPWPPLVSLSPSQPAGEVTGDAIN
ncbi:hypothetical protein [Sphingomonas sp.]|jgi:hypothetical protein|uniref:hypothetical protein n=1 Tax=Sphingomonas sp. TaxID=28214 RepID=UPI002ED9345E